MIKKYKYTTSAFFIGSSTAIGISLMLEMPIKQSAGIFILGTGIMTGISYPLDVN